MSEVDRGQVTELKNNIEMLLPTPTKNNISTWRWDNRGNFFVTSMYLHVVDDRLRMKNWKLTWKIKCPLKVRAFQ